MYMFCEKDVHVLTRRCAPHFSKRARFDARKHFSRARARLYRRKNLSLPR